MDIDVNQFRHGLDICIYIFDEGQRVDHAAVDLFDHGSEVGRGIVEHVAHLALVRLERFHERGLVASER